MRLVLQEYFWYGPPVTMAHDVCALVHAHGDETWDPSSDPEVRRRARDRALRSLDYIAQRYGLRLYPGDRVRVASADGDKRSAVARVVEGTHNVLVRFPRSSGLGKGWYHPRDLTPLDRERDGTLTKAAEARLRRRLARRAARAAPATPNESASDHDLPF